MDVEFRSGRHQQAPMLISIATVQHDAGRLAAAHSAGPLLTAGQAHSASATTRLGLGDVAGCLDQAGRALWAHQRAGELFAQAQTLTTLAEAHERAGDLDTAAACRGRAAALLDQAAAMP
jgi:hypothetical protein